MPAAVEDPRNQEEGAGGGELRMRGVGEGGGGNRLVGEWAEWASVAEEPGVRLTGKDYRRHQTLNYQVWEAEAEEWENRNRSRRSHQS